MGNKLPSHVKDATQSKTLPEPISEDDTTTKAVDILSREELDAKFGQKYSESEEEIQACSGIALKRIRETENKIHGRFANVSVLKKHQILTQ